MPEHGRADRTCEERDRKRCQRLQYRCSRAGGWEKQVREHQHRRRRIDVKVEELDRGADQTGEQYVGR